MSVETQIGKYSWTVDECRYQPAQFDTREEALQAARAEGYGTVWTARAEAIDPSVLTPFDKDDAWEQIAERLFDEIGEVAEDFELSDEAGAAFEAMISEWMAKHVHITQFKAVDVVEHKEPQP